MGGSGFEGSFVVECGEPVEEVIIADGEVEEAWACELDGDIEWG